MASTQPDITQAMVENPNLVLQNAIVGQDIVSTIVLRVSASSVPPPGTGTANTFFLAENAAANQIDATFWIETVKSPHSHRHFLQLQYTQTVMLDFNGLRWPHVSVATLRKRSHATHPHTLAAADTAQPDVSVAVAAIPSPAGVETELS